MKPTYQEEPYRNNTIVVSDDQATSAASMGDGECISTNELARHAGIQGDTL
jgi:hypothetical protein